jgi:hypothetical protein
MRAVACWASCLQRLCAHRDAVCSASISWPSSARAAGAVDRAHKLCSLLQPFGCKTRQKFTRVTPP